MDYYFATHFNDIDLATVEPFVFRSVLSRLVS